MNQTIQIEIVVYLWNIDIYLLKQDIENNLNPLSERSRAELPRWG